MNLTEWKQTKHAEMRQQVKDLMTEGHEITEHFHFSADTLQEIKEEVEVEQFCEIMEDWEQIDLDEDLLTESVDLQDAYEFIPNPKGRVTDVEVEIDLSMHNVTEGLLDRMKDAFFAEEYEYIVEAGMARIVFKRSKGEVYKKKKCAKGMRLVGNKCLPQTGTQKSKERRKGIKLKRAFRAMGAGKKKKAQIKKKITQRRIRGRARNLANTIN